MILSRTLAKRRIAAGVRPSWLAAWSPVLFDFAVFCGYVALIFDPLIRIIYMSQPSNGATFVLLFVVIFVPMQVVLILGSIWAVRSRYVDPDALPRGNQN